MTNLEKVKNWILDHPEWEYGPLSEKEREKLKKGDHYFVWNVYLTNRRKRESIGNAMFGKKTKCRLCWKYPNWSDSMCIHYDFPLNFCHDEVLKWLLMEEDQAVPKEWEENMKNEIEEDFKQKSIKNNYGGEKEDEQILD